MASVMRLRSCLPCPFLSSWMLHRVTRVGSTKRLIIYLHRYLRYGVPTLGKVLILFLLISSVFPFGMTGRGDGQMDGKDGDVILTAFAAKYSESGAFVCCGPKPPNFLQWQVSPFPNTGVVWSCLWCIYLPDCQFMESYQTPRGNSVWEVEGDEGGAVAWVEMSTSGPVRCWGRTRRFPKSGLHSEALLKLPTPGF